MGHKPRKKRKSPTPCNRVELFLLIALVTVLKVQGLHR
jgi:hypothetical protein